MDTCWLLENGVDPDNIRWIMPRDYWWMNRATYQPGEEFLARLVESLANGVEALAGATSVDDLFARLETFDEVKRIDSSVTPTGFHGGFVSNGEMEQLRRIRNVVRLGRVTRIDTDQIVLERGSIPTSCDILHIDCSARGIPALPSKPIFDGDRITLQWVRLLQPTFSWSLIGHVEAASLNEAEKNRICTPIPPPDQPKDWVRMMAIELSNQLVWSKNAEVRAWQFNSRLDPYTRPIRSMKPGETEASVTYSVTASMLLQQRETRRTCLRLDCLRVASCERYDRRDECDGDNSRESKREYQRGNRCPAQQDQRKSRRGCHEKERRHHKPSGLSKPLVAASDPDIKAARATKIHAAASRNARDDRRCSKFRAAIVHRRGRSVVCFWRDRVVDAAVAAG